MPFLSLTMMERLRADAIQKAEDAKTAAEEILSVAGFAESGTVVTSSPMPKETILQAADEWGANLIVCGSHGRKGFSRFLLGSVSEAIASHANCSVEIIRRGLA